MEIKKIRKVEREIIKVVRADETFVDAHATNGRTPWTVVIADFPSCGNVPEAAVWCCQFPDRSSWTYNITNDLEEHVLVVSPRTMVLMHSCIATKIVVYSCVVTEH